MRPKWVASEAPVLISGITGTPGKCLAAIFSIGPTIFGSRGGGIASDLSFAVRRVTCRPNPDTVRSKVAWTSSAVSPGMIRQLTEAVARWGNALMAWPAVNKVATHVVRNMEL